jgi:hypothetical protein
MLINGEFAVNMADMLKETSLRSQLQYANWRVKRVYKFLAIRNEVLIMESLDVSKIVQASREHPAIPLNPESIFGSQSIVMQH